MQNQAHDGEHNRAKDRTPPGNDFKTGDKGRRNFKNGTIDHKSEQSQREQINGQSQKKQNWPENRIRKTNTDRCEQSGKKASDLKAADEPGGDEHGKRRNNPVQNKPSR